MLLDGYKLPLRLPHTKIRSIVKGDGKVNSIAAASIIAKVTRDRILTKYSNLYPNYHLSKHKGYGTRVHQQQLELLGPTPIHRLSYKGVKVE